MKQKRTFQPSVLKRKRTLYGTADCCLEMRYLSLSLSVPFHAITLSYFMIL